MGGLHIAYTHHLGSVYVFFFLGGGAYDFDMLFVPLSVKIAIFTLFFVIPRKPCQIVIDHYYKIKYPVSGREMGNASLSNSKWPAASLMGVISGKRMHPEKCYHEGGAGDYVYICPLGNRRIKILFSMI